MVKWLVFMALMFAEPSDHCPDVPLEGASRFGCRLKQESHGWKLWLEVVYTKGGKWERLEKPPKLEFWPTDTAAFARCSEWRACLTRKLLEHAEERRKNR